jgi:hypothetical protein
MVNKLPDFEGYDQPLLASTVKLVTKLGLQSEQGPWKDYVKVRVTANSTVMPWVLSGTEPPLPHIGSQAEEKAG